MSLKKSNSNKCDSLNFFFKSRRCWRVLLKPNKGCVCVCAWAERSSLSHTRSEQTGVRVRFKEATSITPFCVSLSLFWQTEGGRTRWKNCRGAKTKRNVKKSFLFWINRMIPFLMFLHFCAVQLWRSSSSNNNDRHPDGKITIKTGLGSVSLSTSRWTRTTTTTGWRGPHEICAPIYNCSFFFSLEMRSWERSRSLSRLCPCNKNEKEG